MCRQTVRRLTLFLLAPFLPGSSISINVCFVSLFVEAWLERGLLVDGRLFLADEYKEVSRGTEKEHQEGGRARSSKGAEREAAGDSIFEGGERKM